MSSSIPMTTVSPSAAETKGQLCVDILPGNTYIYYLVQEQHGGEIKIFSHH